MSCCKVRGKSSIEPSKDQMGQQSKNANHPWGVQKVIRETKGRISETIEAFEARNRLFSPEVRPVGSHKPQLKTTRCSNKILVKPKCQNCDATFSRSSSSSIEDTSVPSSCSSASSSSNELNSKSTIDSGNGTSCRASVLGDHQRVSTDNPIHRRRHWSRQRSRHLDSSIDECDFSGGAGCNYCGDCITYNSEECSRAGAKSIINKCSVRQRTQLESDDNIVSISGCCHGPYPEQNKCHNITCVDQSPHNNRKLILNKGSGSRQRPTAQHIDTCGLKESTKAVEVINDSNNTAASILLMPQRSVSKINDDNNKLYPSQYVFIPRQAAAFNGFSDLYDNSNGHSDQRENAQQRQRLLLPSQSGGTVCPTCGSVGCVSYSSNRCNNSPISIGAGGGGGTNHSQVAVLSGCCRNHNVGDCRQVVNLDERDDIGELLSDKLVEEDEGEQEHQAVADGDLRDSTKLKAFVHKQRRQRSSLLPANVSAGHLSSASIIKQQVRSAATFVKKKRQSKSDKGTYLSWTDVFMKLGRLNLTSDTEPQPAPNNTNKDMSQQQQKVSTTNNNSDLSPGSPKSDKTTSTSITTIPILTCSSNGSDKRDDNNKTPRYNEQHTPKRRSQCCPNDSCFQSLFLTPLTTVFPILGSFKDYQLPQDLFTDFIAGFTMAVLHIPQGMAYGLLAGVEPIYGLYVSFIPVLVMALMSKSRHVSYGTFAIISILLMNACDSIKTALVQEYAIIPDTGTEQTNNSMARLDGHSLDDNHQPPGLSALTMLREIGNEHNLVDNYIDSVPITTTTESDPYRMSYVDRINDTADFDPLDAKSEILWRDGFVMPSNIEVLTSLCLIVGLIHISMSVMRLGALSMIFSDQLVSSFTTASAMHVLTSQLSGLVDLKLPHVKGEMFAIFRTWWLFLQRVYHQLEDYYLDTHTYHYGHRSNGYTAMLSLCSVLYLLAIKEILEPAIRKRFKKFTCLPSELTLMIITITASDYFRLHENYQIKIIGKIPSGLPAPKLPRVDYIPLVCYDALIVALVSFALNISLAQMCAKKFKYKLNSNQELFSLGTANVVSSFFSSYPCGSSLSRTAVQTQMNNKSQLASVISCSLVVLILCYFAHILHDLPRSTLSCIIVVALKGILIQCRDLKAEWCGTSKLNAVVWLSTFLSVLFFGVFYGLMLGVICSIMVLFYR